jgi:VanZ family protein
MEQGLEKKCKHFFRFLEFGISIFTFSNARNLGLVFIELGLV